MANEQLTLREQHLMELLDLVPDGKLRIEVEYGQPKMVYFKRKGYPEVGVDMDSEILPQLRLWDGFLES